MEADDLRRRNIDLAATLGDILSRFTTGDVEGQMFRTIHVAPKTAGAEARRVAAG
ncbi:hypothetical protein [Streptomyces sp. NPDC056291]|uniref:hypothetical protein n=1 Tax=Streptomyces sp. NPDC056291 TaxID=3345772 RepID=UPI0035D625ED